jgi:nucleoside-diphosphate-sugar epimerase
MQVLVTGSRGRIGSAIVRQLHAAGHTVVEFDKVLGHDMLDGAAVRAAAQNCDAIIHLASLLGRKTDDPDETMAVGLQGTWHVLMAAKEANCRRVVSFSSVNALGIFMGQHAPDYFPIDDDHPARPRSTYGMMKRLGEQMCEHFTFNTGITTICLRPPGVTMPEYYAQARERRAADPDSEWRHGWEYGAVCHVEDVAAAAVLGLTCPDPKHVTLLLCADDIASDTPSREMAAKVHPEVPWRGGAEYEADPFKALVDNSKAKRVLGWQPKHTWRELSRANAGTNA